MDTDAFVGTWLLVDFELRDPDGNVIYPFGKEGIGIAMIDENGYVSSHIMTPDRSQFSSDPPPAEEAQAAYSSYFAYYGKAEINEEEGTCVTHVIGSLNPDWIGTDQVRYYELSGDRLIFRTPPMQVGGVKFTGTLSWEKAP